jgi:hypothetical protein
MKTSENGILKAENAVFEGFWDRKSGVFEGF